MLHGISNNTGYLFNREMGAGIGLAEPEPDAIITALSTMGRRLVLVARGACPGTIIGAAVQYGNESDLYYEDDDLIGAIVAQQHRHAEPVRGFIHQTSDKQPLKLGFLDKMRQVVHLASRFGTRNICVHLPLDTFDTTPALLDELCSDAFLDVIAASGFSIDLEHNWHGSWFGYPANLVALFGALDDRLEDAGRGTLKQQFALTFDSGHLFAQCAGAGLNVTRELDSFFTSLGPRIRTFHVHGNDGSGDQHRPLVDPALGRGSRSFLKNQEALLGALPVLDLPARARAPAWDVTIISEIAVPATFEDLATHVRLVFGHL